MLGRASGGKRARNVALTRRYTAGSRLGYAARPMTVLAARPRRVLSGLAWSVAITMASIGSARADKPLAVEAPPTPTEAQVKAQEHYKHARELYQVGSYREASGELEAALALDPAAKELVFNLGVVSEKLGKFDEALRYFRHYSDMALSAAEKQRADGFIKRLEGAKNEVVVAPPPPPAPGTKETPPKPAKAENGWIDAATIGVAAVALAGLGVGAAFGIKALSERPKSGFVTGRDGAYADLQRSADTSHTDAVVADIGFGIGVAGAAVAAYLYFARPKVAPAPSPSRASISVAPAPGGGTIFLRGSF